MLLTYGRGRRTIPTASYIWFRAEFCAAAVLCLPARIGGAYISGHAKSRRLADCRSHSIVASIVVLAQTAPSLRHGIARSLAALPLIVLTHIFYGLGFLTLYARWRQKHAAGCGRGAGTSEVVTVAARKLVQTPVWKKALVACADPAARACGPRSTGCDDRRRVAGQGKRGAGTSHLCAFADRNGLRTYFKKHPD